MREIRKLLILDKIAYYETHLSIINCLLPVKMTPMEIEVMAAFMNLEGDIAQYRFGASARKIVMSQKGLSASGLGNYIGSLTLKGFLRKSSQGTDIITIWPLLQPENKEQVYILKLSKKQEEEKEEIQDVTLSSNTEKS